MKIVSHNTDIPGYDGEELRRRMLVHIMRNPDCHKCRELAIDWATVEIEDDDSPGEYVTWEVVER